MMVRRGAEILGANQQNLIRPFDSTLGFGPTSYYNVQIIIVLIL